MLSRPLMLLLLSTVAVSIWLALQPATGEAPLEALRPRGGARAVVEGGALPGQAPQRETTSATRSDHETPGTDARERDTRTRSTAASRPRPRVDLMSTREPWPAVVEGTLMAWEPAPPAAMPAPVAATTAAQAAPAPPTAPPFPYTLVGRFEDDSGPHALLSNAVRTISARTGDVIDGQWHVDATPPGSVELTWMPGSLRQTVIYRPL